MRQDVDDNLLDEKLWNQKKISNILFDETILKLE